MNSEDIPGTVAGATTDADDDIASATSETTDPGTHGPWSIKLMANEDRNAALQAAKRGKISVGEWLGLAIRTRIEFERGEHLPAVVDPPPPPASLDDIERMITMAKMLAEVAQKPPPVSVTQLAYRHLRDRLTVGVRKGKAPARKSDQKAARV
jgi:hypothetical protein